jgi:arginyl-tRNA synthetase
MSIEKIDQIAHHVRRRLERVFEEAGAGDAPVALQKPPRPELGDFAVPCFPLAKTLRTKPAEIAASLAARVTPDEVVVAAEAEGGFLNLRIDPALVIRVTVGQVLAESDEGGYGRGTAAGKLRYLVEYSSPNTNKPLHLGHVRNNVVGLSLCRILAHVGHEVCPVCLVNDRGVHISQTMLAYQRWGAGRDPEAEGTKGDRFVGDLYVEFGRHFDQELDAWLESLEGLARFQSWKETRATRLKAGPKGKTEAPLDESALRKTFRSEVKDEYFNTLSPLGGEARELLRRWEAGDEAVRDLWGRMNGWVYAGFDATYRRLGVRFAKVYYESDTYALGRAVVEQGLERGLFRRLDDGAVVCDYDTLGLRGVQTPYKVLLRSDGTTVYTTQDLGTALARHDEIGFDRQIYVVGDEQKHHFAVLFALLGLVRPALADACHHLAYGMVNLPEGKMKSREGKVVDADDLMDEMATLAAQELRTRSDSARAHAVESGDHVEIDRRAEVIGQAALKFFLLSFNAASTMTFDPAKSIDFLGRTGPYCLNAYARTRSVLAKAGGEPARDLQVLRALGTEREQAAVRALQAMPGEVLRAAETLDPSKVADAVFEVARAFNQLYTDKDGHPIIGCCDADLRAARLLLTTAVGHALRTGLSLLGIDVLEEM